MRPQRVNKSNLRPLARGHPRKCQEARRGTARVGGSKPLAPTLRAPVPECRASVESGGRDRSSNGTRRRSRPPKRVAAVRETRKPGGPRPGCTIAREDEKDTSRVLLLLRAARALVRLPPNLKTQSGAESRFAVGDPKIVLGVRFLYSGGVLHAVSLPRLAPRRARLVRRVLSLRSAIRGLRSRSSSIRGQVLALRVREAHRPGTVICATRELLCAGCANLSVRVPRRSVGHRRRRLTRQ
jgi:hypothetical protein